jgi:hypothetical protein
MELWRAELLDVVVEWWITARTCLIQFNFSLFCGIRAHARDASFVYLFVLKTPGYQVSSALQPMPSHA